MAASATTPQPPVSAQVVGNAFVQQYYHILHETPASVYKFYQDISKLGRPEEDGTMSITSTMDDINSKILSLNYDQIRAEIKSVDSQESLNGGVSVLVTGHMTGKDNILRKFTQSFFLAPQDKGYFVLNDLFRYVEDAFRIEARSAPAEDVAAPVNIEQVTENVPLVENNNNIPEQVEAVTEEPEVINPPQMAAEVAAVVEEEVPVPEVVNEVPEVSQMVVESNNKNVETPKKSYASIVMAAKQNGVPFSSPAPAARKPQPRKQEPQVNHAPPTAPAPDAAPSNVDAVENGIHEEEAEGYSVYIKGLPMSATPAMLGEEFKKFGPIKPNGIQVRSIRGFCFGFVEFETPDAVQKAIEASPVQLGGRNVVVEEKRSTNSRGIRGKFPAGRGGAGFRNNEGVNRGRGNFNGGRNGFNRGNSGEFGGGRNDFGGNNRSSSGGGGGQRGGAPPNRAGDGYQKERVNRGIGGVNGTTTKNMAPRVQATA